ncbi:MAG: hypothetical protein ACKOBS_06290, partial [Verrucomicrobiota bacterium]
STPYRPVEEVVAFWAQANRCAAAPKVAVAGSVTTRCYSPEAGGAPVEYVLDAEGGHGWPGAPSRRSATMPIKSFTGAERDWAFFNDKTRPAKAAGR